VRDELGLKPEKPVVALLPGSRPGEVERLAAPLIEAGNHLAARGIEAVLAPPAAVRSGGLIAAVKKARLKLTPETMTVRDLLQVTDAAVVASGTATLEAAVAGVPMAVVYRLDRLSFAAGKLVFQIPFVALPNWIAGRKVVPELLQDDVVPPLIFNHAVRLLSTVERERQRAELKAVAKSLGIPGVAARVACLVLERLP
jgi:lipid-A-disaccharide synthase